MSEPFKRAPRRKREPAKRVPVSADAKLAYEQTMRERDERERTYLRHLPHPDNKANR